jgi:hypothetical protein
MDLASAPVTQSPSTAHRFIIIMIITNMLMPVL